MANTDMLVINEAYIKDVSTSSPITGGSPIYLRVTSVTYPFKNIIAHKPKLFVDPSVNSSDTSNSLGSNWERRKSPLSYQGMENLVITVKGIVDLDNAGSLSGSYQLATIGRLWKFWNTPSHMPYYFGDSKIGSGIMNTSYDPTICPGSSFGPWTVGSIPVVIEDVTFEWSNRSLNQIGYTMILKEDLRS